MVEEEIRMRRLSFAKYLISVGDLNAENIEPYSTIAILNYHDAIEFLFDLILEEEGFSSNDFSFIKCFEKINEILEAKGQSPSSLKGSLTKLKDRRVALKHKGSFPSQSDILEAKSVTSNIFDEYCEKFYNLSSKDIDLVYLLPDSETKEYLLQVNKTDDSFEKVKNLSFAFEFLLKNHEKTKRTVITRSPYKFLKNKQLSSFNLKLTNDDPMKKYVDITNKNLESLEKNMKILAFGINFNKYVKFRYLIPDVIWFLGQKEPQLVSIPNKSLSENEINFCKNFIIESALRLQQFDFEVPENMGLIS